MLLNGTMYEVTKNIVVDVEDSAANVLDGVESELQNNLAEDYGCEIAEDVYEVVLTDVYKEIIKQAEKRLAETEKYLEETCKGSDVKKITEEEED